MVFSSLLFLFAFLTPHLIIYFFVKPQYKNPVLLAFSLIFYAWAGPKYLFLLLGETAIAWFSALQVQYSKTPKLPLVLGIVGLLAFLGVFKYATFILGNLQFFTGVPEVIPNIVLPVGISFYTFQLLSYVVDVYRQEVKAQPKYWKLLLYSSLFHQCIAGPIVRYETVQNDIDSRTVTFNDVYYGVRRFTIGLAKKAILANGCASIADTLLPGGIAAVQGQAALGIWLAMICYMLEIYLDFSAYSDMAIGMGRMVGFHYLENFNYPYMAKSVQDFWRRWHMSLSSFFRDYVYIPLGGSRCSKGKYIRNMFIVWFLTGMWHGAHWNFILWGLYYFVFLIAEKFYLKDRLKHGHIYTLVVVFFSWIIFKYTDMGELAAVFLGLFGIGANGFYSMEVGSMFISNIFFLAFSIIACTNLGTQIKQKWIELAKQNTIMFVLYETFNAVLPVFLLAISVIALIGNSYNPFLYFQF